jgi:hypothetical protein
MVKYDTANNYYHLQKSVKSDRISFTPGEMAGFEKINGGQFSITAYSTRRQQLADHAYFTSINKCHWEVILDIRP